MGQGGEGGSSCSVLLGLSRALSRTLDLSSRPSSIFAGEGGGGGGCVLRRGIRASHFGTNALTCCNSVKVRHNVFHRHQSHSPNNYSDTLRNGMCIS